jgi:hypothetical protein
VLLPLILMVVRGLPRIHDRVNGNGRERERVAERRSTTTSARSYALAAVPGLRVAREGIVGRGRVSEWALLLLWCLIVELLSSLSLVVGSALRLIGNAIAIVVRARRLGAC